MPLTVKVTEPENVNISKNHKSFSKKSVGKECSKNEGLAPDIKNLIQRDVMRYDGKCLFYLTLLILNELGLHQI